MVVLCHSKYPRADFGYFFQIRYKTNEPVWEENFTFFVHNPKRQELEVEVSDLHIYVVVFVSLRHIVNTGRTAIVGPPDVFMP